MATRTGSSRRTASKSTRSVRTELQQKTGQREEEEKQLQPEEARGPDSRSSAKQPVDDNQSQKAPSKPQPSDKASDSEDSTAEAKKSTSHAGKGSGLRSIWKGAITFGMVTIPVRLLSATTDRDLHFNLLHEVCNSRLKQVRWCPVCDREVPWEETVRGYEYAKDKYVRLTQKDLDSVPVPSKHTIDLNAFVKQEQIDPIYFEKGYYLDPDPTGRKSYSLLLTALEEKQLTAIARIAIREKERLCALRPANGTIVLETLYYADEVRAHQATTGKPDVSERELDMAFKLIDYLTEDFNPENYRDEHREALLELIEAKLNGEEVVKAPEPKDEKVIDLMEALRASLEAKSVEKAGKDKEVSGGSASEAPVKKRRNEPKVA